MNPTFMLSPPNSFALLTYSVRLATYDMKLLKIPFYEERSVILVSHPYGRRTNKNVWQLIVPLLLIGIAVGLLVAAFAQPKQKVPDDWTQLNREVDSALQTQSELREQEQAVVSEKATSEVPEANSSSIKPTETTLDTSAGKLDINRATAEQLDSLKGIGPAKAQAILADREQNGPFQSVDDLLRVKGIGSKLLAGIKDSIVAAP
jgi:competence protein ComEA